VGCHWPRATRGACCAPSTSRPALALFNVDGPGLEELVRIADDLRREAVGDDITYVINRNINFSNVCYVGCRFCAFAQRERDADAYRLSYEQVADRAEEAWRAGASEVCMQGGIDPKLPVAAYAELVRAVKRRVPGMHVHAFSPMEVVTAAAKAGASIRDWLLQLKEAGLDTIPGTAAEILDDEVRWVLTKGKLPTSAWVEVVTTAHELGIRSSSTMMYGHVDHPGHWLGHFRVLAGIQDRTGGFTEFVALPFVHHSAPIYLAGIARPGPTARDNRAVHAMARVLLHGRNPQHPVLLGEAGRRGHRDDAARRGQRPGGHVDGGDHLPDGRLGARLRPHPRGVGVDRPGGRPPGAATHHRLRPHPRRGLTARGEEGRARRRDHRDHRDQAPQQEQAQDPAAGEEQGQEQRHAGDLERVGAHLRHRPADVRKDQAHRADDVLAVDRARVRARVRVALHREGTVGRLGNHPVVMLPRGSV